MFASSHLDLQDQKGNTFRLHNTSSILPQVTSRREEELGDEPGTMASNALETNSVSGTVPRKS
jgi:hypothetical protein